MIRMIITNAKLNSKRGRIKNNELGIMEDKIKIIVEQKI